MKMTIRLLPIAAGALLLGGCATLGIGPRAPGAELAGQTLRTETPRGQTTLLRFERDNIVRAEFNRQSVAGRWQVLNDNLCFFWQGAPRECWPYETRFRRGQPRMLTSDRGNRLLVTRL